MTDFLKFSPPPLSAAIRRLRRDIAAFDLVCPGTLLKRWKKCNRPNCRCASDPAALHGPYYEWSRRQNGRLAHSILTAQQAQLVAHALRNHRTILTLLTRWSHETERLVKACKKAN